MERVLTKFGEFGVWWRKEKLFALRFPDESGPQWQGDPAPKAHELLVKWLVNYCNGFAEQFPDSIEMDYSEYSEFAREVLERVAAIPYGVVSTYSMIAQEIGNPRSVRAVGNAIGRNRLPVVIPCHRVVRSDGTIGGFSSGKHWKERLLRLESAVND